ERGQDELADQSGEVLFLEDWLHEVQSKRPLSHKERLERELNDALKKEDYETAAKVRDELRKLNIS
ncbi:MAG: UvrB/UvrC motif-containing protein, partial [Verrucomicrobiota bacterium]